MRLDAAAARSKPLSDMLALISNIDKLSLWLLGLIFIAVLSAVIEAGYQFGRHLRKGNRGLDKHPIESSVTGTVLGLLAFILAFTLGGGASRFADLRNLALADAIAIENAWVRTDFLPEAERTTARKLLLEYQELRVEVVGSGDPDALAKVLPRIVDIQNELWQIAVKVRTQDNNSILNQFVSALSDMSDAHTRRVNKALMIRLPRAILGTLFFLATLSSFLLGMGSGLHGRRSRLAATAMLVAFCSVIVMIIDLDRPNRSLFQVRDSANEALLQKMRSEVEAHRTRG